MSASIKASRSISALIIATLLVLFLLIAANPAWAGTENNALDTPVITTGIGKTLGVLEIKETTPGSIVEGQEVTLTLINARLSGVTWSQPDSGGPGDEPGAWIYAPLVNDNENNAIEEIEILDQTEESIRIRISKMQAGERGSLLVRFTGDGNERGAVVEQAGDVRIAITSSPDSGFTEGEVTVAKVTGSETEAGQEPQEPLEQEDIKDEIKDHPRDKIDKGFIKHLDERIPASFVYKQSISPLDNWQWRNPLPQGNSLYGVTYGNGAYVAVGDHGAILTSPDCATWTAGSSGTTNSLSGVTYGNGTYVAVGENGAILTSSDGATWTIRSSGTSYWLDGVTYGDGAYVAVGENGAILTSPDGATWTIRSSGATDWLYGVTYGNGAYVAVGSDGAILTSSDGGTWTAGNSGTTIDLFGVTYGNGAYVVTGGSGAVLTSSDGAIWTARSSGATDYLRGVTCGNGTYVAVGSDGAILTSSDGGAWTARSSGATDYLRGVTCGDGAFVAVGDYGVILTSPDGAIWTAGSSGTTEYLYGVTYGNGTYVAVGDCTILTSSDGATWTARSSGTIDYFNGVTYGNGAYVAVGSGGAILTSPDGVTWTTRSSGTTIDLYGVTYGNGTYVAVGDHGAILTSSDGAIWNARSSSTNSWFNGVTYGNGAYVAVGDYGVILTSPDGVTWTAAGSSGSYGYLYGVTYCNGAYVAVGNSGAILQCGTYTPGSLIVQKSGDNLPTGTNVTLTATATGIDNPVYEYWVKIPRDDTWVSRPYSSDPGYIFTQTVPGAYTIHTYCKGADAPYSSAISADPVIVTFTKDNAVCALTVDGPNGNQPPGGGATFTATATDHGGAPLYQFWVHDTGGWRVAQDYSTNNTFTMENLQCGSFTIAACALDRSDVKAGKWDFTYVKAFVINVNSSVSLDAPANVSPGGTVNMTAQAECLTGVEYQYWYQTPDGAWHASGGYTSDNSYSFTAAATGTYKVIVYAKDHYAPATDQFAVWDIATVECL